MRANNSIFFCVWKIVIRKSNVDDEYFPGKIFEDDTNTFEHTVKVIKNFRLENLEKVEQK